MLDKMKQLMDMQRKMQEMKRELENTNFDVESPDGSIKITMNGSQEVKSVVVNKDPQNLDKINLQGAIKDAYNRAIKRSHDIAAEKMKKITGGMNIPGLF